MSGEKITTFKEAYETSIDDEFISAKEKRDLISFLNKAGEKELNDVLTFFGKTEDDKVPFVLDIVSILPQGELSDNEYNKTISRLEKVFDKAEKLAKDFDEEDTENDSKVPKAKKNKSKEKNEKLTKKTLPEILKDPNTANARLVFEEDRRLYDELWELWGKTGENSNEAKKEALPLIKQYLKDSVTLDPLLSDENRATALAKIDKLSIDLIVTMTEDGDTSSLKTFDQGNLYRGTSYFKIEWDKLSYFSFGTNKNLQRSNNAVLSDVIEKNTSFNVFEKIKQYDDDFDSLYGPEGFSLILENDGSFTDHFNTYASFVTGRKGTHYHAEYSSLFVEKVCQNTDLVDDLIGRIVDNGSVDKEKLLGLLGEEPDVLAKNAERIQHVLDTNIALKDQLKTDWINLRGVVFQDVLANSGSISPEKFAKKAGGIMSGIYDYIMSMKSEDARNGWISIIDKMLSFMGFKGMRDSLEMYYELDEDQSENLAKLNDAYEKAPSNGHDYSSFWIDDHPICLKSPDNISAIKKTTATLESNLISMDPGLVYVLAGRIKGVEARSLVTYDAKEKKHVINETYVSNFGIKNDQTLSQIVVAEFMKDKRLVREMMSIKKYPTSGTAALPFYSAEEFKNTVFEYAVRGFKGTQNALKHGFTDVTYKNITKSNTVDVVKNGESVTERHLTFVYDKKSESISIKDRKTKFAFKNGQATVWDAQQGEKYVVSQSAGKLVLGSAETIAWETALTEKVFLEKDLFSYRDMMTNRGLYDHVVGLLENDENKNSDDFQAKLFGFLNIGLTEGKYSGDVFNQSVDEGMFKEKGGVEGKERILWVGVEEIKDASGSSAKKKQLVLQNKKDDEFVSIENAVIPFEGLDSAKTIAEKEKADKAEKADDGKSLDTEEGVLSFLDNLTEDENKKFKTFFEDLGNPDLNKFAKIDDYASLDTAFAECDNEFIQNMILGLLGKKSQGVRTLQNKLDKAGFSPGGIDGVRGKNTCGALTTFLKKLNSVLPIPQ